ncbi:MAG: ribosome biogenesis GTPase YlqF [Acholeplasmatales bacterium]|nr:ribosome biogenesis GTPase YlqF [Acholeplasmatales bacterium]
MNDNVNNKNINWYPGHMEKAKKEVINSLKLVDLVIELLDARIPYASANPLVDDIVKNKPRIKLLNKADMADKEITKLWIEEYKKKGIYALDIDSISKYNLKKIDEVSKLVLAELIKKKEAKGIKAQSIRALIIGIPNVGKSTLINSLSSKKKAKVGNKPGVTKVLSWLNITDFLQILDTPGILWPKFEDQTVAYKLALTGAIKDDILDIEDLAYKGISFMKELYPNRICEKYKLEDLEKEDYIILEDIAKNMNLLLKGGKPDTLRAAKLFLNDLRNQKLGAISYERPGN